jgi:membrane protein DedA with SNARE-associated domain
VLNTLGALLWATTLSVAGYRLGRVLELVAIWQGREATI